MKRCKKCVMPDTRPGITFNKDGICSACINHEKMKGIDWEDRWAQLEDLAAEYRGCNGDGYDCIIAASAGKDSYYQIYLFKQVLHMNPLIVSVNNFTWSKTGEHNWKNMLETFDVDAIQYSLSPKMCKKMFRKGLKKGIPTWVFDRAIYAFPIKMAVKLNIPLVVYGENINYTYGGSQNEETYSAIDQINNDVAKSIDIEEWIDGDITRKDLACIEYPTKEAIERVKLNPIYLSYFVPWSGYENMQFARARGFKTLDDTGEWKREGFIEQYDQIDTVGYLVHSWFKFPKFGHARVTDVASIWIREGRISREEAIEKVREEDWKLDKKMLEDFLNFIEIDEKEFWEIVDDVANTDLVHKVDGVWRLKE